MKKRGEIHYLEPSIVEKNIWNLNHFFTSLFIGLFLVAIFIIIIKFLNLDLTQVLILFLTIIIIYSIILFFLLEPKRLREIQQPILKTIANKPIYKQIPYETVKKIYVTNPKKSSKKTPIKKFNFYASTQSKTYHKNTCRLSRLMKRKYKIGNDKEIYFTKNKYRPCKVCIQNQYPELK